MEGRKKTSGVKGYVYRKYGSPVSLSEAASDSTKAANARKGLSRTVQEQLKSQKAAPGRVRAGKTAYPTMEERLATKKPMKRGGKVKKGK